MAYLIIWIGLYFFNEIILSVKTERSMTEELISLDLDDSLKIGLYR